MENISYEMSCCAVLFVYWLGVLMLGLICKVIWQSFDHGNHLLEQNLLMQAILRLFGKEEKDAPDVFFLMLIALVLWPLTLICTMFTPFALWVRACHRQTERERQAQVNL